MFAPAVTLLLLIVAFSTAAPFNPSFYGGGQHQQQSYYPQHQQPYYSPYAYSNQGGYSAGNYNPYHYGSYNPYYSAAVPFRHQQQQQQPYNNFYGYQQQQQQQLQPAASTEGFSWKKLSKSLVQSLHEFLKSEFSDEEESLLKTVQFNEEHSAMLTFPFFDENADGSITAKELGASVRRFIGKKPSSFYLEQKIAHYDSDGDGSIDYEEYENMMEVPIISDDKKIEQFGLFDRDNDGKITPTEVHEVLGSFAQSKSHQSTDEDLHHHVQEIIGKHDHDGDGVLTHADIKG